MVLHAKVCGRVGRCRHYLEARWVNTQRAFFVCTTCGWARCRDGAGIQCGGRAPPGRAGLRRHLQADTGPAQALVEEAG